VKRRNSGIATFVRTAEQWESFGMRPDGARTFALFPFLGIARLFADNHMTEHELSLIRSIAEGSSSAHPLLSQGHARRILFAGEPSGPKA
jgi:hypothetical protein